MVLCKPSKLFLTGPPGSGKSTIIRNAVRYAIEKGIRTIGFFTPDIRDKDGKRIGFDIEVINYGNIPLARKNIQWNLKFGNYYINPEAKQVFKIIIKDIGFGSSDKKLIIIDEIGPMELLLEGSKGVFTTLLQQETLPVLGVFHRKLSYTHPDLYKLIKRNIVYELSFENREIIINHVIDWINSCYD